MARVSARTCGFGGGYPPAGGGSSCHSTSSRSLPCFRFQNVIAAPIAARIAVNLRSFRKKPFFFLPVPSLSSPKGTLLVVSLDDSNHRPLPDHGPPKGSRSPRRSGRACSEGVARTGLRGVLRVRS